MMVRLHRLMNGFSAQDVLPRRIRLGRRPASGWEICFYVSIAETLTPEERKQLCWLVAETFEPEYTADWSFFGNVPFVEIGPRLNFETPFSSNAVAICHAMGLKKIRRIERSFRYPLTKGQSAESILAQHLDRMTQDTYPDGIKSFDLDIKPAPVVVVPVLERGETAIQELNISLGLGMDAWDVKYYADLFRHCGKNPTDVALFQIGNANSEHSRHPFFKGRLVIDGTEMPESLFDIVRAPLKRLTVSNSILAFNDNAGAIQGYRTILFVPARPGHPSRLIIVEGILHPTCTAETHNHPTGVAPYPGAGTGIGGRIRDNSAAGRGSLPAAGVSGYCVGNLFLEKHIIPGEKVGGEIVPGFASARKILIEGSNGISDYANSFGEPLIGGFVRSFEQIIAGERRAFRKPVLYTGGIGRIDSRHVTKHEPKKGMLIVRIGGPAYRIGVGGGSASSMMHGANTGELDFKSVQRGNPEMKNRVNRAITTCVEMGDNNPIESIHDQGAGGPSNVLTELMAPAGGKVDIRKITLGDETLSVLEIWSAEFQEGYGLLIKQERLEEFKTICARERVNCEIVGEITGDGRVVVIDSKDGTTPVDLNLADILTKIPRKTFELKRIPRKFAPLVLPVNLSVEEALRLIFLLPQVGSKGYLEHKVDRSVTGLVVRQPCCGPTQMAVADVGVTADSYFGLTGAAEAIGEQPIKMLINPAAGARLAVGEMLTNLAAALISKLTDVRCRANWMWPAKLPGEGARLYDAAIAMRDIMIFLGIAPDGGKDSLSMASKINGEIVKAPGQLVILGYAPVPDINKVLTPDFKGPGESLIGFVDLGKNKNRLGGSSLAQAFGQIGNDPPDVDNPLLLKDAFYAVQELIVKNLLLSYHDRSDGGLITTIVEMCLAGNCGATITFDSATDLIANLFSEELGFAFELNPESEFKIRRIFEAYGIPFTIIGKTKKGNFLKVYHGKTSAFNRDIQELRQWWEATSLRLEEFQTEHHAVESERQSHKVRYDVEYRLSFTPIATPKEHIFASDRPKVAVVREEGTNGDREMAAACFAAGLDPWNIAMSDLLAEQITLDEFQGLIFPGGFSFMDVFDSGKGWAGVIRFHPKLREMFDRFYERSDTFSLGVCNGCQLMALLGWIPWRGIAEKSQPRFIRNESGRFESRWTQVKIMPSPSVLLQNMEGSILGIHVAHGEGKLVFPDPQVLDKVTERKLAPLAFVGPNRSSKEMYPYNPNGSSLGLTALCSPDGRHLAMMPHPERCFLKWQWPWMPEYWKKDLEASPWLRMFQNARSWCLKQRKS